MFTVSALRCEFTERPLGLSTAKPRFSWAVGSSGQGSVAAYQILVASSRETLDDSRGDLWDTGQQPIGPSPLVEYAGVTLHSRQRAWWTVRLWDDTGRPSAYADPEWFEVALLDTTDWRADWIGHSGSSARGALYLRRPFVLPQAPRRGRLYVTGLGWHEAHLNGHRLGRQVLDPAPTNTSVRVPYNTHDVTDLLREGENVLGGVIGHGWTGAQKLLAQLEVVLADGTEICIFSGDGSVEYGWMAFHGPVVEDSIFDGELYDSRLENRGWADAPVHFTAAPMRELFHAMVVDPPGGVLEARMQEAIEVVENREVASISEPQPGIQIVDTGQNLAGWLRIAANGAAGTEITLRYAESLYPDGTVDQRNLRSARATDRFILNGSGRQVWEPSFTYHGFRYVQVEGYPGKLDVGDADVRVVRSAMAVRGDFSCDNELINTLGKAVFWTETSNVPGVPTDCPQRNERMGWLNDLAARSEELVHTFDTARFLPKWMMDVADTQDEFGAISDTAPFHFGARPADPVSVCFALIPWLLVTHHGDLRTADIHFDSIQRWFDYLTSRSRQGIVDYSYYGDWAPPAEQALESSDGISAVAANTPGALISTAHYYLTAVLLERLAGFLGREADSARFGSHAAEIKIAFNQEFYRGAGIGYGTGNQACNAVALYLELVPDDAVAATVNALVADIHRHDNHLTTGNLCTKYALETLFEHGHADLALAIVTQTSYPSWGYMIANGATTIWERWEHEMGGGMNSHNHPMYASVGAWFYRRLAGIQVPADAIGMSRVVIRPPLDLDLGRVAASLQTVRGTLRSTWQKTGGAASIEVSIPFGMTVDLVVSPEWRTADSTLVPPTAETNLDSASYRLDGGTHRIDLRRGGASAHPTPMANTRE